MPSPSHPGRSPAHRGKPDAAAVQRELRRLDETAPRPETPRAAADQATACPSADQAFLDSLNGDP